MATSFVGRISTDASTQRYRYHGLYAEKDQESGFNSFELRQWDSRLGRWMVPDPFRQYHSPYVGMGNNPVVVIDPSGGYGISRAWISRGIWQLFEAFGEPIVGLMDYIYNRYDVAYRTYPGGSSGCGTYSGGSQDNASVALSSGGGGGNAPGGGGAIVENPGPMPENYGEGIGEGATYSDDNCEEVTPISSGSTSAETNDPDCYTQQGVDANYTAYYLIEDLNNYTQEMTSIEDIKTAIINWFPRHIEDLFLQSDNCGTIQLQAVYLREQDMDSERYKIEDMFTEEYRIYGTPIHYIYDSQVSDGINGEIYNYYFTPGIYNHFGYIATLETGYGYYARFLLIYQNIFQ